MARLTLSKSALQQQRQNLQLYRRFLPSLDLKRRQLTAEQARAKDALDRAQGQIAALTADTGTSVPMLAHEAIDLSGLVTLESFELGEENVLGVRLPALEGVSCTVREYSLLAKPHWVDSVAERLSRIIELKIQAQVQAERVQRLDYAIRRTTQRVNLFDKVLIPGARRHIQRIQIFLADTERAAVVRSKIAKGKHKRESQSSDTAEATA